MPKKNATQFWLRTDLINDLEAKKNSQGRVEGMATYIETILNQFVSGHLIHVERSTGRKAIYDAKMRLLEIYRLLQELEEKGSGSKSLRGGKGPLAASEKARALYEESQRDHPDQQSKQPRHQRG